MRRLIIATILAGTLLSLSASAQETKRPRLLGLSKIVVRSHDLNASRHFYGDLLGFQESFTILRNQTAVVKSGLPQDQASSVFFKVNNRQYIVVMPESNEAESRYIGYAIETDDAEAMRLYLKSLGYSVPDKVSRTPTHDLAFELSDPEGDRIEVMQYTPESLSVQNYGKDLSDSRLSYRILHTGFTISKPETTKFYLEGFSVREFWRADPTMKAPAAAPSATRPTGPLLANLSNLKLPESDDYIEWSLSRLRPGAPGAPRPGAGGHIALVTPDNMAKTVAAVEARPAFKDYTRQHEAHVGVNHKWQGNFFDPDGTRVEFMELDTADGLPSPMSHAPYF
jgi:catechol 2,3-dioxygenase-like lactoylglutathione lyase family enzyme